MHPGSHKPDTAGDLARYFNNSEQLSQHETLGQIIAEILRSGSALNRTATRTSSGTDGQYGRRKALSQTDRPFAWSSQ